MKTYEELLSDIEDDMELMGALHIVYAMEENGVLTGYVISRKSLIQSL